jgi:hypothetical protein
MGHQQPPWAASRAWQPENQIPRLTWQTRPQMSLVGFDLRIFSPSRMKLLLYKFANSRLLAAWPWNGE